MSKLHMTALELRVAVDEIAPRVIGARLQNVYDAGARAFEFRFGSSTRVLEMAGATAAAGAREKRTSVLFELGTRLHLTTLEREKPRIPTQFIVRLRKAVRSWRVTALRQIGVDRIVVITFGGTMPGDSREALEAAERAPPAQMHLYLEVFGQGNAVLTDAQGKVLVVCRPRRGGPEEDPIAPGAFYAPHATAVTPPPASIFGTRDELIALLRGPARAGETLGQRLKATWLGQPLIRHLAAVAGVSFQAPPPDAAAAETVADALLRSVSDLDALLSPSGTTAAAAPRGYLFLPPPAPSVPANPALQPTYDSFSCAPLSGQQAVPTATMSEAVERFFLPQEQRRIQKENDATQRISKTDAAIAAETGQSLADIKEAKSRRDIQRRVDAYLLEEAKCQEAAELITANAAEVDGVITLISDALASGISWPALARALRQQQGEAAQPTAHHKRKAVASFFDSDGENEAGEESSDTEDESATSSSDATSSSSVESDLSTSSSEESTDSDEDDEGDVEAATRRLLSMIHSFQLERNRVTLLLTREEGDVEPVVEAAADSGEEDDDVLLRAAAAAPAPARAVPVCVDVGLNARDNAAHYFQARKRLGESRRKTEESADYAAQKAREAAVHKTSAKGGKKGAKGDAIKQQPKRMKVPLPWFTNYFWFVTSVGDLVVTAKDPAQSDTLLTKYLDPQHDIVCLTDVFGTLATVLKPQSTAAWSTTADSSVSPGPEATSGPGPIRAHRASVMEACAAAASRSPAWTSGGTVTPFYCHPAAVVRAGASGAAQRGAAQGQWSVDPAHRIAAEPMPLQLCGAVITVCPAAFAFRRAGLAADGDSVTVAPPSAAPSRPAPMPKSGKAAAKPNAEDLRPPQQPRERRDVASDDSDDDGAARGKKKVAAGKGGKGAPAPQQQQQAAAKGPSKHQQRKAKMMEKKYGEQDEDDRARALALLGSKPLKSEMAVATATTGATPTTPAPAAAKGKPGAAASDAAAAQQRAAPAPRTRLAPEAVARNVEAAQQLARIEVAASLNAMPRFAYIGDAREVTAAPAPAAPEDAEATAAAPTALLPDGMSFFVCAPVPSVGASRTRVLIGRGNEKRGDVAKTLRNDFVCAVGPDVAPTPFAGSVVAGLEQVLVENVASQLPATAKVIGRYQPRAIREKESSRMGSQMGSRVTSSAF